jgi:hypothetical protein
MTADFKKWIKALSKITLIVSRSLSQPQFINLANASYLLLRISPSWTLQFSFLSFWKKHVIGIGVISGLIFDFIQNVTNIFSLKRSGNLSLPKPNYSWLSIFVFGVKRSWLRAHASWRYWDEINFIGSD